MTEIIVALIAGACGIIGAIISAMVVSNKVSHQLVVSQAVTDTKIEELTREVREHNNFARRVPVLEEQMDRTEERLHDLEKYHKQPKGG